MDGGALPKGAALPLESACPTTPQFVELLLTTELAEEVVRLLPALTLIDWRARRPEAAPELQAPSPEYQVQALFRPLLQTRALTLAEGTDEVAPKLNRARMLVAAIRAGLWSRAFDLAEQAYRAAQVRIVTPTEIEAEGDRIAAALLVPMSEQATIVAFRRAWLTPSRNR